VEIETLQDKKKPDVGSRCMIRGLGGPGSTAMHIPASIELRPIIFGNSPVSFLRELGPRFISRYCNSVKFKYTLHFWV